MEDTSRPEVSIDTAGEVEPVNGLLEVAFTASDPEGLAAAILAGKSGTIGELKLSGTTCSGTFVTPLYTPDTTETFSIAVYDIHGNRQGVTTDITVLPGQNQAPRPFFKILPSTAQAGESILLDATGTSDVDGSSSTLLVEWDLDGDGVFDTTPSTNKRFTIAQAAAGNWLIRCRVTDSAGAVTVSTPIALRVDEPPPPPAAIVARQILYNNSAWDGNSAAANGTDDSAIANDKAPLLPGQTATFANYTSYDKGLTGLVIDVRDLRGTPTLDDFLFRAGNDNKPYGSDLNDPDDDWLFAPLPTSITVRSGAGVEGSDRLTLIWDDGAIRNCWLQVTVLATDVTGLAERDVFYVGNAVGESGNSTGDAIVNATDEIGARNHPRGPFNPAAKDDPYDFNRDKLVNATDQIIARNNRTSPFTALKLIQPPLEDDGRGEGEAEWTGAGSENGTTTGAYQNEYRAHRSATGALATWTFDVPAGDYELFAAWVPYHACRAINAPVQRGIHGTGHLDVRAFTDCWTRLSSALPEHRTALEWNGRDDHTDWPPRKMTHSQVGISHVLRQHRTMKVGLSFFSVESWRLITRDHDSQFGNVTNVQLVDMATRQYYIGACGPNVAIVALPWAVFGPRWQVTLPPDAESIPLLCDSLPDLGEEELVQHCAVLDDVGPRDAFAKKSGLPQHSG